MLYIKDDNKIELIPERLATHIDNHGLYDYLAKGQQCLQSVKIPDYSHDPYQQCRNNIIVLWTGTNPEKELYDKTYEYLNNLDYKNCLFESGYYKLYFELNECYDERLKESTVILFLIDIEKGNLDYSKHYHEAVANNLKKASGDFKDWVFGKYLEIARSSKLDTKNLLLLRGIFAPDCYEQYLNNHQLGENVKKLIKNEQTEFERMFTVQNVKKT